MIPALQAGLIVLLLFVASLLVLMARAYMGTRFQRRVVKQLGGRRITLADEFKWHAKTHGIWRALLVSIALVLGIPALAGSTLVTPANSVWAGGTVREWASVKFKVKTVTNLRSGVFVIRDTDDDHIKAAGAAAANVIGVLTERNFTDPAWDRTGVPTTEDEVEVLVRGVGCWAVVRNGAAVLAGDQVATSATGRAAAGHASNNTTVAIALKDNDGSGAESDLLAVI